LIIVLIWRPPFSDESGQPSATKMKIQFIKLTADCPAAAGLTAPSGNLRFPDGHPDKDTLAIIKEGCRNVNASEWVGERSKVYLLENKGFFLTG
jgi:hypothetical protein